MMNPKFLAHVSIIRSIQILYQSYGKLDRSFQKPPSLPAFNNIQNCKQHFRQEIGRIMKRMENLIVETYGPLDDNFRAKLRELAHQSQIEAFASFTLSNQSTRPVTAASRRTSNSDKPLLPIVFPTNTNPTTQECRSPSQATVQWLKKGVEDTTHRKAEAYETSSSTTQEKNRTDNARSEDITSYQTVPKSMIQGENRVRDYNPFRRSSPHREGTFFPSQNMHAGNGVDLDFPNPTSTLPNLPPTYSTSTLTEPSNVTVPSSTLSSAPSLNPFILQQSWDHGNSASLGQIQPLNQGNMDSQWYLENDWRQNFSTGGI